MRPCSRTVLVLVVALALALGLAGTAGAHSGHKHATAAPFAFGGSTPAPASAYRGLTKNPGGRCGDLYEIRTKDKQGREKVGCTHGPDPAPPGAAPGKARSIDELRAAAATLDARAADSIACDGTNSTGMRVVAIYAYTTDQTDRYAQVAPLIREWASHVEDVYYESARETAGSRSVRWLTEPSPTGACRIKVEKVALTPTGDDSFNSTLNELHNNHGMTALDRRFIVWMDGANTSGICGIGEFWNDDKPGQENANNGGVATGYYGLTSRIDVGCWGNPGQSVEGHELGHNLGAVQASAPNDSGGGHCVDEWDIMCYSDSPNFPAMQFVCGTQAGDRSHDDRLDCNHDDYFHTSPPVGNYLATHWNVANNNFLQEARIVHDATTVTATGDGDTVAEPGETVSFTTRVQNRATTTATGVSGSVLSASADSTPVAGAKAYPNIAGGATGVNSAPHGLTVKSTAQCGATLPATVRITASSGTHDVPVAIPTGAPGAPVTSNATPGSAIPDSTPAGVTATMTLPAGGRVADVDVRVNISHTWDEDVELSLTSPDGTTVELFGDVGGSGDNFVDTVLDDEAATAITAGAAPFTGSFRPEGSLGAFDGKAVGGVWTLRVVDDTAQDTGTLNSWGITRRAATCAARPGTTLDTAGWSAAPASAKGDVNGDGFSDLVVGAPGENSSAGAVHVIYGTASGLATTGSQMFTQDSPDVADTAEASDRFGAAIAVGDLSGDGRADVAIGAPGEDTTGGADAGVVHVLYGSAGGLSASSAQLWAQGGALGQTAEAGDHFGAALAIGDVGKSAHGDLAVGVPDENLAVADAGVVQVVYGAAGGLLATGSQLWSQGAGGLGETAEATDRFGASLAVANLGRTAHRDLAVGAPYEDLTGAGDAGVVHAIYGGTAGLSATNGQVWSQNSTDVGDAAEVGDHFGVSLAAGDLGKTGTGDLAVGVPDENVGAVADAGLVHVLYGTEAGGLAGAGSQLWSQGSGGLAETAEASDRFGLSLAVANFGRTSQRDLAIGVPTENLAAADAGVVHAVYGTATGLAAANSQVWQQGAGGLGETAEAGDRFGLRLATGQYGRSAQDDLAVGVPFEDAGAVDSGLVQAVYGTTNGLAATNSQMWSQAPTGIADAPEAFDGFGGGLGR